MAVQTKQSKVFISGTARDLPEHRKQVLDACLRQGMFPMMMEHLPANDAEAILASLNEVDESDIYLGVFAHRYGYVPKDNNPQQISITEMEYNRAVERKIPRLIFIIDKTHPLADFTINDIDTGENAAKLERFKKYIEKENIVNFFKSPSDLRALVINSLSQHRQPDLTTFHYVSDIPAPPEAFIAHPYTLLQARRLIGRLPELNLLTDWVARPESEVFKAHLLNIISIGGLGKSALTWKWFNDVAPQEMKPLAGRMWWSFYESEATFENFVTRALAYVSRRALDEVQQIPTHEREAQLLATLDREPYLVVLDGLERILIAYARIDSTILENSQADNQRKLRKTADPRAGRFLKKLTQVKNTRILVNSRIYPAELETERGGLVSGSFRYDLKGLTDEEAVELWRAFDVSGSRDLLLPIFATFDKHPLLIQALAGEVKRFRRAPGNFEAWRKANPRFDKTTYPGLQDAMSHVLEYAMRGLDDKARQALQILAAFRMPPRYDTLAALLIGKGKACVDEHELDEVLTELEDRGLVGWDKRANSYDLHPIVRGVVWSGLGEDIQRDVYTSLRAHFEALPKIDNYLEINSLEDLTPASELYNTLIGLGRFDDAERLFHERLDKATLYRLSANRQRVELLEMLFPDGLEQLPRLNSLSDQAYTLNALALGYHYSGQPGRAVPLLRRNITIQSETKDEHNLSYGLISLSDTLRLSGALREAETSARRALVISREQQDRFAEAASLYLLGLTLATRGVAEESESALQRALRIQVTLSNSQREGLINSYLAQRALWFGDFASALSYANRAWELAYVERNEGDFISAARVQGAAALGLNDFARADERLHHALTRARMVNFVEEELAALIALAELRRRQGDVKAAREFLDDIWEAAEGGPYPLAHTDACNVLTQIERELGNLREAADAAAKGYRLGWCDGPPFAYHWGLLKLREHLQALGEPEPSLPVFDESKYAPLPTVNLGELEEQVKEVEPPSELKIPFTENRDVPARSIDSVITFFKASGYIVNIKNQNDLQVTPARLFDKENYGSSLVRYLEKLPKIEDIQDFCKEALLIPDSPVSGYKPAFLVCPRLEPVHQLQAAVYQDKKLAVVPMTYDWILEANARGEQRKNLQSVLDAFVGRDDPFFYSNPVSVPGDFYGRKEVVAALVRDLDRGQSVGLFGMRKIGKTSLIQHTLRTRTGPTIYIDCQGLTHPATILRRLPQELRLSLKKLMPKAQWPDFDVFDDEDNVDLEILTDVVSRYLRDLHGLYVSQSSSANKITIILDEVDRIVPTSNHSAVEFEEYESLFGLIRSLGQGMERILVCMVAGFSADITQKDIGLSRGIAGNPVYAFFNVHRLKPMEADEIAIMMNGLGSRALLLFTEGGNQRLYQWSGGHPFLSRMMGSVIHRNIEKYKLQRASIEGSEAYEVDERAVDQAADDLLDDVTSRPFVSQILERFSEPLYKDIFLRLAEANLDGCKREELMKIARDSESKRGLADALNTLEIASLTRKEGNRFKLFANLLRELILRGYV
jgi:tetratricopeptide (TPR) repeat protein